MTIAEILVIAPLYALILALVAIVLNVNIDMIGTMSTFIRSAMLEGAPVSRHVINGLAEAVSTYTRLAVETSLHPFASDHVPVIGGGLPAVLTIEGADSSNSNIHPMHDPLEHINYELTGEVRDVRRRPAHVEADDAVEAGILGAHSEAGHVLFIRVPAPPAIHDLTQALRMFRARGIHVP
jgi:Zn-dependent M28 family amino/carboxypeptidase